MLQILPISGIPEVKPNDSLAVILTRALDRAAIPLLDGDLLVVAQKVVSKAEGRLVRLDTVEPSELALKWSEQSGQDPRLVELVLRESRRVVRMDQGVLIVETRQGWICANAGIDASNTPPGTVALLPEDCDKSARQLREALLSEAGRRLAVVISDSHGRPWRVGQINVALGVAGMNPLKDYRGKRDATGKVLRATLLSPADEAAAAAGLAMGKARGIPAVLVRGLSFEGEGDGRQMLRRADEDLFR